MPSLVKATPKGVFNMISSAFAMAVAIRSSPGTTVVTRPIERASAESNKRPVNINSCARAAPTRRGSSQLVPMSQADRPIQMKAALNLASVAAMRMSEPRTRANPPPAAGPFTAEMMGWGNERIFGMREAMCRCTANPFSTLPFHARPGASPYPPRSSPAQKPLPAPVKMTTRTEVSTAMRSKASCSSWTRTVVIAFNDDGRFNVTVTTPSFGAEISTSDMPPSCHDYADHIAPDTHDPHRRILLEDFRTGRGDPTVFIDGHDYWRATWTPNGPASMRLHDPLGTCTPEFHGPGADWMSRHLDGFLGLHDRPFDAEIVHEPVRQAHRRYASLKLGRSGTPYHELLPAVLGQRVTGLEAATQWRRLVQTLGHRAPGPCDALMLPPDPEALARTHHVDLHDLGIEKKRADALRSVARAAHHLIIDWPIVDDPSMQTRRLTLIPGVGTWTAAVAGALAFGDADALAVGDFHLKNLVAWTLTGRARGTDAEMVATMVPYTGHRHRVVRWLQLAGHRPPAFGPRRPIVPITQL